MGKCTADAETQVWLLSCALFIFKLHPIPLIMGLGARYGINRLKSLKPLMLMHFAAVEMVSLHPETRSLGLWSQSEFLTL